MTGQAGARSEATEAYRGNRTKSAPQIHFNPARSFVVINGIPRYTFLV
jgi:hypothetical protein